MKTYSTGEVIARRQIDGMESEDWVPADVAQRLYDTLERVLNSGDWFGGALEFSSYEDLLGEQLEELVRATLAAADGEDDS